MSLGVTIRCLDIKAVLVGTLIFPNSEVVVLMLGILYVYPIILRVCLIDQFRQLFKLLMDVNLVLVIALVRMLISLQEVHLLAIVFEIVTPGQPNLMVLVQHKEHVTILDILVIIFMSALVVG